MSASTITPLSPATRRTTSAATAFDSLMPPRPERGKIAEVDQKIDHRHGEDAADQDADHVAARVAHLARQVGGLVPAAIGEQHEDHGEAERPAARRGGRLRRRAGEETGKRDESESGEEQDLHDDLQRFRFPRADHVERGERDHPDAPHRWPSSSRPGAASRRRSRRTRRPRRRWRRSGSPSCAPRRRRRPRRAPALARGTRTRRRCPGVAPRARHRPARRTATRRRPGPRRR